MNSWWSKFYLAMMTNTLLCLLLWNQRSAVAQSSQPQPIIGPRLNPTVVTHSQVQDNYRIYNEYIVPALPLPAQEADINDQGQQQEEPGRGVREKADNANVGTGLRLKQSPQSCNDFNQAALWGSASVKPTDIWSEHYGGWYPFAFDDNNFYQQENVSFAREQVVGPGTDYGPAQYSFKIASGQPYAAGIGSPLFHVKPGAIVEVSVKYLIFDHDFKGQDYDWAALGLKPDATGDVVTYVNGYKRGGWFVLTQQMQAGASGTIMILLQAHSPAALNSNIYFDDVTVLVDGLAWGACVFGE